MTYVPLLKFDQSLLNEVLSHGILIPIEFFQYALYTSQKFTLCMVGWIALYRYTSNSGYWVY